MKKIYLIVSALTAAGTVSFGQNINPTVEVTNTYQGKPSEVNKPQVRMSVPDSLLRFGSDFDYEVFDKPYEGTYSFKPYMLNMRPGRDAFRGKRMYLRAGAGYSLHPQLDFIFSPEQQGPFQMSVYASHKSYFGKYDALHADLQEKTYRVGPSGRHYKGYDGLSKVGFDGRYSWDKAILSLQAGYYGILAKDTLSSRSYNACDFNLRLRSNSTAQRYILYDVAFDGRFGNDNLNYQDAFRRGADLVIPQGRGKVREGDFRIHGDAGPVLDYFHRVLLGFDFATLSYNGGLFEDRSGMLALTPKYEFETSRWNISVGLRIEKLFKDKRLDTLAFLPTHRTRGKTLYPDVHVRFNAAGNVALYAGVTGGASLNAYSQQLAANHHFSPLYALAEPLMDFSSESMHVQAGVKGNLWSRLQFDLNGGVSAMQNGLIENALPIRTGTRTGFLPATGYEDYNVLYANALLDLRAGHFKFDADMRYCRTTFENKGYCGFALPAFTGDFKAAYDFNARAYCGVRAVVSSARNGRCSSAAVPEGVDVKVPGYIDLGVFAGYQLNRKFGLWVESGNLLCESVQRNLFHAENDLWITGGIALIL